MSDIKHFKTYNKRKDTLLERFGSITFEDFDYSAVDKTVNDMLLYIRNIITEKETSNSYYYNASVSGIIEKSDCPVKEFTCNLNLDWIKQIKIYFNFIDLEFDDAITMINTKDNIYAVFKNGNVYKPLRYS